MGKLPHLLVLFSLVSSTLSLSCNNSYIAEYIEKRENATQELINDLQTIVLQNPLQGDISNSTINETTLYNTLVASLNLTGSSDGFQNFSTALNVISESYFKACFGPADEKPTKAVAPELLSQFLFLLENRTNITTVRELYGQLSCLKNFSQSPQFNKGDVSCASKKTIEALYDCVDQDDLQCIFNLNDPINCFTTVDLSVKEKKHCLGFAVDTTGSMSEEISHAREVVKSFIASEENTITLCYVLVPFNDYSASEWPNEGSEPTNYLLVVIHTKLFITCTQIWISPEYMMLVTTVMIPLLKWPHLQS